MSLFLDLSKIIAAGCRIGRKCRFGPISVSQGHWCSAIASHMVKMRSGKPLFRPFRFPLKRQKLGRPGSGRNDEMPVPKMDVAIAPKVSWCVLMPIGQQQIMMASQQEVARPKKLQKKAKIALSAPSPTALHHLRSQMSCTGAVRRMRTRLSLQTMAGTYAEQGWHHSVRAVWSCLK